MIVPKNILVWKSNISTFQICIKNFSVYSKLFPMFAWKFMVLMIFKRFGLKLCMFFYSSSIINGKTTFFTVSSILRWFWKPSLSAMFFVQCWFWLLFLISIKNLAISNNCRLSHPLSLSLAYFLSRLPFRLALLWRHFWRLIFHFPMDWHSCLFLYQSHCGLQNIAHPKNWKRSVTTRSVYCNEDWRLQKEVQKTHSCQTAAKSLGENWARWRSSKKMV